MSEMANGARGRGHAVARQATEFLASVTQTRAAAR